MEITTLLIPDAPGNNRLDSLENVVQTGRIGLLFLVPGVDETLRVNGSAILSTHAADLAACADANRTPKLVIRVTEQATYLHCAKAVIPSMGEMMKYQIGGDIPCETQGQMLARYAQDL